MNIRYPIYEGVYRILTLSASSSDRAEPGCSLHAIRRKDIHGPIRTAGRAAAGKPARPCIRCGPRRAVCSSTASSVACLSLNPLPLAYTERAVPPRYLGEQPLIYPFRRPFCQDVPVGCPAFHRQVSVPVQSRIPYVLQFPLSMT